MKNIRNVASDTFLYFDKAIGGYIIELIEKVSEPKYDTMIKKYKIINE